MSGTVSGTTRELACLTLGHDDADEPACSTSDEQLVAELVEEVQALRVAAGVVEETEADRQAAEAEVADALDSEHLDGLGGVEFAATLLAILREDGWTLLPVRLP